MGKGTHLLIELTNTFGGKSKFKNVKYLEHNKEFDIGDITVHPFLMDHSACDAYAFLLKNNGKSLLYTGDFRLHGRKSKIFDFFKYKVPKNINYLLMEGSAIERSKKPFKTEEELEKEFIETFKQNKGINLVFVSSQNIDRLVSIYNACKKTGRIFLIDFYTANILKTLNKEIRKSIPFPCKKSFPEIKVFYPKWLTDKMDKMKKKIETIFPFTPFKICKHDLDSLTEKLVMLVRPTTKYDLEKYIHNYTDSCFIYSMWDGYKNKPGSIKDFLEFITGKGIPIIDIHTSGHADLSGLRKMAEAVQPKNLVPIHTFKGDNYSEYFPGFNVKRVYDGVIVEM